MNQKFFRLFLFLLWPLCSFSQKPDSVCSVQIPVKQLYIDRLNRIYVVNSSGLFQFNRECRQTASFTQRITGGITSVDVSNPLKIIVFAQAEQKIYLLDDRLHIQSVIPLADLGIRQASLVCNSRGDGFRVYDEAGRMLVRFDNSLKKEYEVPLTINAELNPVFMRESQYWVLISNPPLGVLVADRYGNYVKTIEGPESGIFHLEDQAITFLNTNSFKIVNVNTGEIKTFSMPLQDEIKDVIITGEITVTCSPESFMIGK